MKVNKLISERRSIRNYKSDVVEKEKIDLVLEAGRLAPSARNRQKWKFYVVQNEETRVKLREVCRNQKQITEAPVSLIICAVDEYIMGCGISADVVDCSIALSFMMLQAEEIGLGTCWLGAFDQAGVKSLLNIPENETIVAVTPLGYPDEKPAPRPRKELEEVVVYLD